MIGDTILLTVLVITVMMLSAIRSTLADTVVLQSGADHSLEEQWLDQQLGQ